MFSAKKAQKLNTQNFLEKPLGTFICPYVYNNNFKHVLLIDTSSLIYIQGLSLMNDRQVKPN